MKKLFPFISIALLAAAALLIFAWWSINAGAVSTDRTQKDFVITRGSGASLVAKNLEDAGLIKSPLAFRIYTQATNKAKSIQAGQYELSPSMSLIQLVDRLTKGPAELWVTVPEGLRREEIAERFIAGLSMPETQADAFRKEFMAATAGKEGFLFPDTYLFSKTATAAQVASAMQKIFDKRVTEDLRTQMTSRGYTLSQMVTLASIIERETKTDDERPMVAGVLLNRLNAGWPLQADATVQYAIANSKLKTQNSKLEKYWEPTTVADRNINSPYNTYKRAGLPPGPIASPGLSSIKAVAQPTQNDYWYYLHDTEGKIHFAKTLEEHNENIQKFLE